MDTMPEIGVEIQAVELQWSHDLSAMDTRDRDANELQLNELQWSHDLSAMDTTNPTTPHSRPSRASMEP